jgi:hypothetical protein
MDWMHRYIDQQGVKPAWTLLQLEGEVEVMKKFYQIGNYLETKRKSRTGWIGPKLVIGNFSLRCAACRLYCRGKICEKMGAGAGVFQELCIYPGGKKGLDAFDEEFKQLSTKLAEEDRISDELWDSWRRQLIPFKMLQKWDGWKIEVMNATPFPSARKHIKENKFPAREIEQDVFEFLVDYDEIPTRDVQEQVEQEKIHEEVDAFLGFDGGSLLENGGELDAVMPDPTDIDVGDLTLSNSKKRDVEEYESLVVAPDCRKEANSPEGAAPVKRHGSAGIDMVVTAYDWRPTPGLMYGTDLNFQDVLKLFDPDVPSNFTNVFNFASLFARSCSKDLIWHVLDLFSDAKRKGLQDRGLMCAIGRYAWDCENVEKLGTTLLEMIQIRVAKFLHPKLTAAFRKVQKNFMQTAAFIKVYITDFGCLDELDSVKRVLGEDAAIMSLKEDVRRVYFYYTHGHTWDCHLSNCRNVTGSKQNGESDGESDNEDAELADICENDEGVQANNCKNDNTGESACKCKKGVRKCGCSLESAEPSESRLQSLMKENCLDVYRMIFLDPRAKDSYRALLTPSQAVVGPSNKYLNFASLLKQGPSEYDMEDQSLAAQPAFKPGVVFDIQTNFYQGGRLVKVMKAFLKVSYFSKL